MIFAILHSVPGGKWQVNHPLSAGAQMVCTAGARPVILHKEFLIVSVFLIHCLGKFVALLPDPVKRAVCVVLANVIWYPPINRRKVILGNLRRAFPERDIAWCTSIGKESCARIIEMGMFVLVSPHLTKADIQKRFTIDPSLDALMADVLAKPAPLVILAPHFSLMEAVTLFPALTERPLPKVGVLYRPLNNPRMDSWVKRTRERWGIRLLSRKDQLLEIGHLLRDNGAFALLFDQNAGSAGAESLFFGRPCSNTELPGMMTERFKARVGVLYAQRTGFFRAVIRAEEFDCPRTREHVIMASNRWLENALRGSESIAADWLWAHNRWGRLRPTNCLGRMARNKSLMVESMASEGAVEIPNKDRIFITLPEDPQTLRALIPALRAHKADRPEAHIVALATDATCELACQSDIAHTVVSRSGQPLSFFAELGRTYTDAHVVFVETLRADREARRVGALIRVGAKTLRPRKPWLTHTLRASGKTPAERALSLLRACGGARYLKAQA